jgi:pyruvate dehydrogenase E2 component (dihydrolipoamide acetyltransferase)
MPDLGTTVEEFKIMAWLVGEGDFVEPGDALAEIETDKAVTQLESTAKGVVLRLLVEAGDTVYTGDTLAYIGAHGEALPQEETPAPREAVTAPADTLPSVEKTREAAFIVSNLAAHLNVELGAVRGSGQGGVITREDVLCASAGETAPAPVSETLSRGQAAVARAVTKSWTEIPHLFIAAAIDMSAAQRLRARSEAVGRKLSYDAIFLHALAQACKAYPTAGAHLDGERIVPAPGMHIAFAVGREDELFLPVVRDVDRRSLAEIQAEIEKAVAQVKAGTLPTDRMAGACMAISNLGMYPIESFDPIIFPGHSIMLAVGGITPTPVVIDGGIHVRPICNIKLAADHRLINGRLAAAFVSELKACIENLEG